MTSNCCCARVAVGFALCVVGCNRYEYRTIDCGPALRPTAVSAIGWESSPSPNTIIVRVRTAGTGDQLPTALAGARVDSAAWTRQGADGLVHFDSIPPGPHLLIVRAFGHRLVSDTVLVQPDSGVVAFAVMARDRTRIDEACGWMRYRARKPWWKLW